MKTVIVKIGDVCHKHNFPNADDNSLTIGRAFSNDVVLADPYIGPSQLKLHLSTDDEYDWHVSNGDDTNPVFLNKKIIETPEFNLRSGDELMIGRTNMAIYTEDHAIPKTREFSFTNWLHNHKFKPLIASAMLVLLIAVTLLFSYLEVSSEPDWGDLSVIAIVIVIIAIVWASGWSLTGHLLKGNHFFFSHLFFTSICFGLIVITGDFYSYADYFFSSPLAGQIVDWLISIVLLGLLIGFNLALVTYSPKAFRNGLITSACILGVLGSLVYLYQEDYSNQPVHSATIKPSYIPTTTPVSTETYVENYNVLFDTLASVD